MKFRIKTTLVDAMQWTGSNVQAVAEFVTASPPPGEAVSSIWFDYTSAGGPSFTINAQGVGAVLTVSVNDWVVRDADGRLSSLAPEAFAATYDPEPS